MIFREWLYSTLNDATAVTTEVDDRIFQGESLESSVLVRPFLVYTIGNATDEEFSEDTRPYRQFFQIYVHDTPTDYTNIDRLVGIIKALLKNASSKDAGVIWVHHLETSRDLDDASMGTIMRYLRFQAIMEETP